MARVILENDEYVLGVIGRAQGGISEGECRIILRKVNVAEEAADEVTWKYDTSISID
jgi:hypothetical protein